MAAEVRWLGWILVFIFLIHENVCNAPFKRIEYKLCFKPPYLAQKDGTVPFWQYGGNAIASAQNVRVAPSLRSQKGAIWSKLKTSFNWWEVELVFRVSGRGRIGADGLALWYTEGQGSFDGEVFGSSDKWNGLGIFFDSFDNDNKHNNPYIMAVVNDGTRQFDHSNDGVSQMIGGCLKDFRNKPYPTRAKIEYYQNTLTVLFHNGMTNSDSDYDICIRAENVYLPPFGHFGVSAATGGLADDHDVLSFITHSLYPPGTSPQIPSPGSPHVSPEDQEKLSKEYAEYQQKLELQKEEYRKEHPDAKETKDPDSEYEEWYESDNVRELRQIYAAHSQMMDHVRILSQKLDEVVGRQERTLSMLSGIQSGGIGTGHMAGAPVAGQPLIDTIRRHEVDGVINNLNSLLSMAQDLRLVINDIQSKSDTILQNQARAPTAQVQSVGYDMVSLVNELRDGLNTVKRDTASTAQRLASTSTGECPNKNCLNITVFLVVIAVQLLCMLGYSLYRENEKAQAKKLY
uniref:L-type lectin-like domain-containing protein n=1 Tax=Clastoptera arizonana TaxID=38151 RepID=A0A1B6D2N9_9HEMI